MRKLLCVIPLVFLFCFTISCQNKAEKVELEKFRAQARVEEQNKELMRKVTEEWNKGNYEFLRETQSPDYAYYFPSANPKSMSGEEIINMIKMAKESFPDVNLSIEEIVAVGDMVISRLIVRGTHMGMFQGIPATGNKFEVSVINWCHIRDGKIVEEREEYDMLTWMQQLGMELKPKGVEKK